MASQAQAQKITDQAKALVTKLGGDATAFNWAAILAEIQTVSNEAIAAVEAFFGIVNVGKTHVNTAVDWASVFKSLLAAAPQLLNLVMTVIALFSGTPVPPVTKP